MVFTRTHDCHMLSTSSLRPAKHHINLIQQASCADTLIQDLAGMLNSDADVADQDRESRASATFQIG